MRPRFSAFLRSVAALAAALAPLSCGSLSDPVVEPDLRPALFRQPDTSVYEGQRITLRFSASTQANADLVYALQGVGTLRGRDWSWRPGYDQAGTHFVRLVAHVKDRPQWADTLRFRVIVLEDTLPGPRIDAIRDTTIRENQRLSLRLSATDPRLAGIAWSMTGPEGATFREARFDWRPTYAQSGVHDIVFRVADFGSPRRGDSLKLRVTVTDVDRAPEIGRLRDTILDTGRVLTVALSASDPDDDPIAFSLVGGPPTASITGSTLTWKPSEHHEGLNILRVVATARGLSDTGTMRVTVTVPRPPTIPPVSYWSFDEGAGSRLHDSTGGRHGQLHGNPVWVDGVSGKALRFNGQNYVEAPLSFPSMTAQTLSAWVYMDTLAYMTFLHESDGAFGYDNELSLSFESPEPRFLYRTRDAGDKGRHHVEDFGTPQIRRWYHFAAAATADTVRLYINGVLRTTRSGEGGYNFNGYHHVIQIGRKNDGASFNRNYLRGVLDEIKVYDRALPAQEIQQEWNRHKAKAGY